MSTHRSWYVLIGSVALLCLPLLLFMHGLSGNPAQKPVAPTGHSDRRHEELQPMLQNGAVPEQQDRTVLSEDARPVTAEAIHVLAGTIIQKGGGQLGRTYIKVEPPDRSLLSASELKGSVKYGDVPPSGAFHFQLPATVYGGLARIHVTGGTRGEGETELFDGVVHISENVRVFVPGLDAPELRPIEGVLSVSGKPMGNGFLVLQIAATQKPVSFQPGLTGNDVPVSLRVVRQGFDSIRGPVELLLDDKPSRLCCTLTFNSIAELRAKLERGVTIAPTDVLMLLPELGPSGVRATEVKLQQKTNAKMSQTYKVHDSRAELRLCKGAFTVVAHDPESGRSGYATFWYDGASTQVALEWDYVTPGGHSVAIRTRDRGGEPVADAKITLALAESHDHDADKATNAFLASGESGPDGRCYLAGLFAGKYTGTIRHAGFATTAFELLVPARVSPEVVLKEGINVRLDLRFPEEAESLPGLKVFHRRTDHDAAWGFADLGTGSRDYTLRGLTRGRYEFVVRSADWAGRVTANLSDAESIAAIPVVLQKLETIHGQVLGAGSEPLAGVIVDVVHPSFGGEIRLDHTMTDSRGGFALTALASSAEELVVSAGGVELARARPSANIVLRTEEGR